MDFIETLTKYVLCMCVAERSWCFYIDLWNGLSCSLELWQGWAVPGKSHEKNFYSEKKTFKK